MADANYTSNRPFNLMPKESEIIGSFAQGQKQSLASENLKLEYTDTSIRLSDRQAILVGISKQVNKWQRKVLISNKSVYKDTIVQTLVAAGFIVRKKSSHPEFTEYHHYQMPDGYKLNYTEVIQLWRAWWHNKRYQLNVAVTPIDVLFFSKGNWCPVQDLQPKQGSFILHTAKGEISIEPEEYIVWIDRAATSISIEKHATDAVESPLKNGSSLMQKDYISDLPEPEEYIDLETYLSTFNTEDSEDIDRIEGIYNIDELLSGAIETVAVPAPESIDLPVEPAIVAHVAQIESLPVEPLPSAKPQISAPTATFSTLSVPQRQASLKLKAMNVLDTYLREGDLITHTEVLKNAQGQEINRKVTSIQRSCPSWAIEQIKKLTSVDS
jgi:hypothetical protein